MTVSTEISHEEYAGNGVTTVFPYRFRITNKSYMLVKTADLDGNEATLVLNTDYTLTGVKAYSGGNVVLTNALPIGWRILLERNMPLLQGTDLRNQGSYFAEVHEDAFDYMTMLIQKVAGWFNLALRRPSWISNHYDAQGYKISNVNTPTAAQDATNKGYVDGQIGSANANAEALFGRTLRVPGSYIPPLPPLADGEGKTIVVQGGVPRWVTPESGTATDVLVQLAAPTGGQLSGLAQGGTLQDTNNYVTLESLGYLPGVSASASDALDAFIAKAKAGDRTALVLESNHDYPLTRNHVFDFPHSIIGRGANFSQGAQQGTSKFVDARGDNAGGYLLTIADGDVIKTYGWTWFGIEVAGTRSNNNNGVMISAEGYAFGMSRIIVRNFGKTGVALNAVLDGVMSDLFIGACGGYVDGTVYYGLDLYPDGATYVCNLIGFYRLHIEHCRYMMRLAGFDLAFTDCHLEIGMPGYSTDMTPCVNVRRLLRPITFNNCYFTSPGWDKLVQGITDTSSTATIINSLPHFIGTTYTSAEILGGGEYDSRIELRGCSFASYGSYALYVSLSAVPVDISKCHIMNAGMPNSRVPFIIGPRSKVADNKFFVKAITGDTSVYASVVNDKVAPAIQVATGFGSLIGNDIYLFNATPSSLVACVIANIANSIIVGNHLVNYTQEVSGTVAGSQVYKGLRVTDYTTMMDMLPGSFATSGTSMAFRLPSVYTNSNPVYGADSTSFNFSPSNDTGNGYLGLTTARWSEIRAKTATINTSDGRLKSDVRGLSDAEITVAKQLKTLIRAFVFNADAYMPPHDADKIHFGVIAQDAVAAFETAGLDPENYALIVHDVWEAKEATYDSDGKELTSAIEAGDRYGIRYEELLAFIIASS